MPRTLVNGLSLLLLMSGFLYLRPAAVVAVRPPAVSPPEPPRSRVDATLAQAAGDEIVVPAGGDLQAALDAAKPGDNVVLASGAVYRGSFRLPPKSGEGWIVVRGPSDQQLPPAGTRVSPDVARAMPKLESASGPVLVAPAGAHHYRLVGLELRPAAGTFLETIVDLGRGAATVESLPHHLVVDRCYLHGDPGRGARLGIALNSRHTAVVDSYLSEFKDTSGPASAIASWNGAGPFRVENCHLEAAGTNLVFGKPEAAVPGVVAADVEIRGNHVSKSLAWMRSGSPGRPRWATAGLLELRNARRVLVDGNLFEQRWHDGATDPAILFASGRSGDPAAVVPLEDVTFSNNLVRRVNAAIGVAGGASGSVTRRIAILNNLFYEVGGAVWGGEGTLFRVVDGTEDVIVEHNTASHGGSTLVAAGAPHRRFVFRNNITVPAAGRLIDAGAEREAGTLESHFPRANVARNVMAGVDPAAYPPDNFFPASVDQVGFLDAGRNDYRLDPASPYRSAGTDGKDLGVDYAEFLATRGLVPAPPLPVPRPTPDSSTGPVVAGLRPVPQDARP